MTIMISDDCPLLEQGRLTAPALIEIFLQIPTHYPLTSIEKRGSITLLHFGPSGDNEIHQIEEQKVLKLVKREGKR